MNSGVEESQAHGSMGYPREVERGGSFHREERGLQDAGLTKNTTRDGQLNIAGVI